MGDGSLVVQRDSNGVEYLSFRGEEGIKNFKIPLSISLTAKLKFGKLHLLWGH
jgi:hypothetical protein